MSYLSESTLRTYAKTYVMKVAGSNYFCISPEDAEVTIFLSHSHKDRELVRGLISFLAELGVKVYVDWNDNEMPRITTRDTATRIKGKIEGNQLFAILATANAMESKWVPWETGVADQVKGESKILVIPVTDLTGTFAGSEYLQLYKRVEFADSGKTAIFNPGKTSDGILTESFLRRQIKHG